MFFFIISRGDHQSGVDWQPAVSSHHHFTRHHLLPEGADEGSEVPEGHQRGGWGELLTQVQTPVWRIRKPRLLGKQRRH